MVLKDIFKIDVIISVIGGVVSFLVGGTDELFMVFFVIMCVDLVTGILKAINLNIFSANQMKNGIIKKMAYILALIVVSQLDLILGDEYGVRTMALFTFIANETMSIIENVEELGVEFPKFITIVVDTLRKKGDIDKNQNKNQNRNNYGSK